MCDGITCLTGGSKKIPQYIICALQYLKNVYKKGKQRRKEKKTHPYIQNTVTKIVNVGSNKKQTCIPIGFTNASKMSAAKCINLVKEKLF